VTRQDFVRFAFQKDCPSAQSGQAYWQTDSTILHGSHAFKGGEKGDPQIFTWIDATAAGCGLACLCCWQTNRRHLPIGCDAVDVYRSATARYHVNAEITLTQDTQAPASRCCIALTRIDGIPQSRRLHAARPTTAVDVSPCTRQAAAARHQAVNPCRLTDPVNTWAIWVSEYSPASAAVNDRAHVNSIMVDVVTSARYSWLTWLMQVYTQWVPYTTRNSRPHHSAVCTCCSVQSVTVSRWNRLHGPPPRTPFCDYCSQLPVSLEQYIRWVRCLCEVMNSIAAAAPSWTIGEAVSITTEHLTGRPHVTSPSSCDAIIHLHIYTLLLTVTGTLAMHSSLLYLAWVKRVRMYYTSGTESSV